MAGTSRLDKLIGDLQKTYPNGVIMDLRKGESPQDIERVPLESPKIESLFGIGGVPRGRIIEIYGPESGGKTSLCEYIAGQFQKADLSYVDEKGNPGTRKGRVAYIDAENAISLDFAQIHGFDYSQSILVQPESGEQACDIAIQLAESGEVDLIVLDSIATMTPKAEIDADMENMTIGLHARMLSKFFRKITAALGKTNTTLLCVNQIRMNIGSYGNPETTCVTPDTPVEFSTVPPEIKPFFSLPRGMATIEDMFLSQGVDWRKMEQESEVPVTGDLFISSFVPNLGIVPSRVLKLIRKADSKVYSVRIKTPQGTVIDALRGTPAHRIYIRTRKDEDYEWRSLKRVDKFIKEGKKVYVAYQEAGKKSITDVEILRMKLSFLNLPILDMEVEETHNYFANGILSHNTGGNALKFASSVRIEVRRREYITEKDEIKGILINAKSVKNKTAPPMVRQQLEMYYDTSFDASMEWVDFAIEYQVISSAGAGFFTLHDGTKIRGKQNVIDFLKDPNNTKVYEEIKRMTKERMYQKQKDKPQRVSADYPDENIEE